MVDRFLSQEIELSEAVAGGQYSRADLIFDGVDHSLASYEGRVYINAPEATIDTGREDAAYAGSFHIFGHGGCFGDVGHCEVPAGPRAPFDLRAPHRLTPATKVVIITESLKRIIAGAATKGTIGVTVVVNAPGKPTNEYLRFSGMRLVTYR